ncbi:hypothetical protein BC826DRAFT_970612 [Russula brevipes]|nr:hypothetical protein BC826DRAFT_970612 [Russula brevipes]
MHWQPQLLPPFFKNIGPSVLAVLGRDLLGIPRRVGTEIADAARVHSTMIPSPSSTRSDFACFDLVFKILEARVAMTTTNPHPRGSEFYQGMPDFQFHVQITTQAQVSVLADGAESGGQELGRGHGGPILRIPLRSHCALASWRSDLDKQCTGPAYSPSAAALCAPFASPGCFQRSIMLVDSLAT